MKISCVILTKNEAINIKNCLNSLKWCDEIIIVDDNSSDKTESIARSYKAKVYKRELSGDFSAQRNFGLSKAKNDWVIFIDSDEQVSDNLAKEIREGIKGGQDGFIIKREDFIFGKKLTHGETGNIKLLRVGKKDKGKWFGKVHETWQINGKVSILKNSLYHRPHQSIEVFLREVNFYTSIRARELFDIKNKASVWDVILYPKVKFFLNFVLKLGFLDGIEGFIEALMMSFHSFLVRAKLWKLWNDEKSKTV